MATIAIAAAARTMRNPISTFTGVHGGHFQGPTHHPKRAITARRIIAPGDEHRDASTDDGVEDK
jgi:hypothetical protein